ncbi:unnamed protein product, partial [Dracunculus medinensis]|uniref:tRNA pseudouridine(55) synthase n=1 Tax=Dracunculus medinensis TaxID=318479 RepID=A0A0N4UNV3_DRAME
FQYKFFFHYKVSEKIEAPLIAETNCESSRFIASGREDIDVRMLGYGRPFAVQLINPRLTKNFHGSLLNDTLKRLTVEINKDKDIRLPCNLQKINDKELNILKVGQDEKRKCYTAYCYYTQKLCVDLMENLQCKTPFQIIQKTPVRVLRRRPLLDRIRTIYNLHLLMLDDFHFLMRIETQAGTYVKEFVHGDFGRTRPSLAELLKVESGEMDILQLDVEKVDMEWPPRINLLD